MTNTKEIPGFPGYAVTRDGRVLSWRTNFGFRAECRELSPGKDAKGYRGLILCATDGTRRSVRVHRLVAESFVPNPMRLPCVRHLDGNPENNVAENLAWGTYKDNEEDKIAHGTWHLRKTGKLSEEDRHEIFKLWHRGVSQKDIAKRFKVSRPTVTRLLNGTTWQVRHAL